MSEDASSIGDRRMEDVGLPHAGDDDRTDGLAEAVGGTDVDPEGRSDTEAAIDEITEPNASRAPGT